MDIKRNTEISNSLKEIAKADNLTPEQAKAIKDAGEYLGHYSVDSFYGRENSSQLLAKIFEDTINSSDFRKADFVKRMTTRCHRYLQGEFFKTIMCVIKTYATYPDHMFDGRNKFVQEICQRIVENDDYDFKYERSLQDIENN